MRLLAEGQFSPANHRSMTLNEESNKKIADLYFMVLLNTLIRSKVQLPFELPEKEITAWDKDYPLNEFVSNLEKHKSELKKSVMGKEIIKTAAEYATLYESTSGKNLGQKEQKLTNAKSQESSTEDKLFDSLSFLWGVVNGLTYSRSQPIGPYIPIGDAANLGYGLGMFAKTIFELGSSLSSSLSHH
ncbi:hypothetical protein [Legionella gresilensis]|uniref:hypothetical protein n=1 Tax=Legionella gresilensis TaxID=91823 RepID=UPI001041782F|nr:hypothetical protein [Legionella gresilensis]